MFAISHEKESSGLSYSSFSLFASTPSVYAEISCDKVAREDMLMCYHEITHNSSDIIFGQKIFEKVRIFQKYEQFIIEISDTICISINIDTRQFWTFLTIYILLFMHHIILKNQMQQCSIEIILNINYLFSLTQHSIKIQCQHEYCFGNLILRKNSSNCLV